MEGLIFGILRYFLLNKVLHNILLYDFVLLE